MSDIENNKIICNTDLEKREHIPEFIYSDNLDLCLNNSNNVYIDAKNKIDTKSVNTALIKAKKRYQAGYILVADLYNKCKSFCDNLIFTAITDNQFINFVNEALEDFYNLKPSGWNFTLSEPYSIDLQDNKCVYELPEDFKEISYVTSGSEPSNCMPANHVFEVIPYEQWDTVQGGYFVSYRYDTHLDLPVMYIRLPDMPKGCYNSINKKLKGTLYVKYYKLPERIESFKDKIYDIPKRWGGETILTQIIVKKIHSSRGRLYQENESFLASLQRLKKIDSNISIKSPIYKNSKPNLLINNSLIN